MVQSESTQGSECVGVRGVATLLLLTALVFVFRPYNGIRHDSILYFGQALNIAFPTDFASDLFFKYGSQASFTLFPILLGHLLAVISASWIGLFGTALSFALFFLCSWLLLRRLFGTGYALLALLSLAVWPAGYGGFGVFSYLEAFFTGRSLAEPLVLLGLALLLSGRTYQAILMIALAALLHPLQALPGVFVWWLVQVRRDRRWIVALGVPLVLLLASLSGVEPAQKLFARYDAEWLDIISEPNRHVFLLKWPMESWAMLARDFFVLYVAFGLADGRLKEFIKVLLIAGLTGLAASFVLADSLHLVLATGLQIWRVQWLLHWTAMAALPMVALALWRGEEAPRCRFALFGIAVLMSVPIGPHSAALATFIAIPLFLAWPRIARDVSPVTQKILSWSIFAAALLGYGRGVLMSASASITRGGSVFDVVVIAVSHPLVLVPCIAAVFWLCHRRSAIRAGVLVGLALIAAGAAAGWDRRSDWSRTIETHHYTKDPFGRHVEQGAQIFWYEELVAPWLVLHRPSYWSGMQEAGLLFNRGTAVEANKRHKVFSILELQSELCKTIGSYTGEATDCTPDDLVVKDICAEANPDLRYLVLPFKLKTTAIGEWRTPGAANGTQYVDYLYSCEQFTSSTHSRPAP